MPHIPILWSRNNVHNYLKGIQDYNLRKYKFQYIKQLKIKYILLKSIKIQNCSYNWRNISQVILGDYHFARARREKVMCSMKRISKDTSFSGCDGVTTTAFTSMYQTTEKPDKR